MNTPQLAAGRPAAVDLLCTIGEGGSIQVTFRTPNGQPYDASAITQFRVVRRLVTLTGDVTVSGASNEIVTATITPALAAQLTTERGWRFMLSDPTAPKTWVAGAVVAAAPAHAGILSPRTDVVAVVDQVHITVVVAGPPGAAAGGGDLSDATPEAPGTPAAGTAVVASRGDHVHAPPTAGQIGAATPGDVDAAIAGASLDGSQIQSGTVPDAHIPSSIARDSEVSAAVSAHAVAVDPHGDRAHAVGLVDDLSGVTDAAAARSNLGLGALATLSAVSSAEIVDGTIVNADIGAGAAIALSKLAVDPLARANHTGTQAQSTVTNLVSDLAGKAATVHTHSGADLTSGTVGSARLGTGTADSSTFLRGDGTWAAPAGDTGYSRSFLLGGM